MESRTFEKTHTMYTTIKGRYEKGKLILEEVPPSQQAEVLVIFQENSNEPKVHDRRFGCVKGLVTYMADDFNEPLEDLKEYM